MLFSRVRAWTVPPGHQRAYRAGLLFTTALAAAAAGAQTTQFGETASELYLDLSTGIRSTDNYEYLPDPVGTTTLWTTDVALGYTSETQFQTFSVEAGARLELGDFAENPDTNGDLINPFLRLDYGRQSKTSSFDATLAYRETDNGIDLVNTETSTDLIVDQGTQSNFRVTADLETGVGTPVRTSTSLYYNQRRYFDTTNVDLSDQDTFSFDAELGLAITRSAELILLAEYYDRDDIDDINSDEIRSAVGIGINADVAPDLSFRGILRYEENEYTSTVGTERVTDTKYSPTLDLSFVKDRQNGVILLALGGELASTGVRTTARLGRQMELPHGAIEASIGVTHSETGNVSPVGSLDWLREYKTRQFSVGFDSSVDTDEDDNEILFSSLGVSFEQALTQLDGLQLNLAVSGAEGLDESYNDRRQASFSVSYYRQLTSDWQFVTGYRHAYYEDNDETVTTENEVFATVDRRFSLRP